MEPRSQIVEAILALFLPLFSQHKIKERQRVGEFDKEISPICSSKRKLDVKDVTVFDFRSFTTYCCLQMQTIWKGNSRLFIV